MRYLIDKINYCHFQDRTISLILRHNTLNRLKTIEAKVLPCDGFELICQLTAVDYNERILSKFEVNKIHISFNNTFLYFYPKYAYSSSEYLYIGLPEYIEEIMLAEPYKSNCQNVQAQVICEQDILNAKPLQFNSSIIELLVYRHEHEKNTWISFKNTVLLLLYSNDEVYFSGHCNICTEIEVENGIYLILELPYNSSSMLNKRKYRSQRIALTPSPEVIFKHPIDNKLYTFKAKDISGKGISFEVPFEYNFCFPRLTIPNLSIRFGFQFSLVTKMQIIYCMSYNDESDRIICGGCFLNLDLDTITNILGLLQHVQNEKSYVDDKTIGSDQIWKFFFESGFIPPDKYANIAQEKDKIKSLYTSLYSGSPHISKQFTYQENGEILAHVSMVRFFERAWLIHHHAADNHKKPYAGIKVLSQVSHYVNEVHHYDAANMDKVMCFYQTEKKFPERVFGGVAYNINDRKKCSTDTFAYIHSATKLPHNVFIKDHLVEPALNDDIEDFIYTYNKISNGLLLNTFHFRDSENLIYEYNWFGMHRNLKSYVVCINNITIAIILVVFSDISLNLSNLTNCIYFFCIDQEKVTQSIINSSINEVSKLEKLNDLSIMIFPYDIVKNKDIYYEKKYTLWILNLDYLDEYFEFCNKMFKNF